VNDTAGKISQWQVYQIFFSASGHVEQQDWGLGLVDVMIISHWFKGKSVGKP
jgi:hypothetical protein